MDIILKIGSEQLMRLIGSNERLKRIIDEIHGTHDLEGRLLRELDDMATAIDAMDSYLMDLMNSIARQQNEKD